MALRLSLTNKAHMPSLHESDIQAILNRRHNNGADYWASPDGRIYVGNPFSTIASLMMLHELGVGADHEAVTGGLALIINACREDGRIRIAPGAPLHPCYTAEAARVMCRFGLTDHDVVLRSITHLLDNAHGSGGWRCNFTGFGRGPETECANPGATLYALDVIRFFPEYLNGTSVVDQAVASLLDHWNTRKPAGPCHWGIGSRFLQIEYPFLRYNLFYYVYILSFFDRVRGDSRFTAALHTLENTLDENRRIIVQNRHRSLKELAFCNRNEPSELATQRYREARRNLTL